MTHLLTHNLWRLAALVLVLFGTVSCHKSVTATADSSYIFASDGCSGAYSIMVPMPANDAPAIKYSTQSQILFLLSYFVTDSSMSRPVRTPDPASGASPSNFAEDSGRVSIPCLGVPEELRASFKRLAEMPHYLNVLQSIKTDLLSAGAYNKYRYQRHQHPTVPATSSELLKSLSGKENALDPRLFNSWLQSFAPSSFDIKSPSRAKARSRAILRLPRLSIALTLDQQFYDSNSPQPARVLETEMIIARDSEASTDEGSNHASDHNQFDFYVYNTDGELDRCSSFFSGTSIVNGPSPHTCMGCHYNQDRRTYTQQPKSFSGAAIEDWTKYPIEQLRTIDSCH